MAKLAPIDHDPFAGPSQAYKLVPVDHDPFEAPDERSARMMLPTAGGQPNAVTPQPRFGDALKPAFGGHNPIAETADLVWPKISPEDQAFRDARGLGERAIDTAAFVASAPVRVVTRGQYGLGDAVGSVVPSAGESISQAEASFARANAPMLNTMAAIGEVATAVPPGAAQGVRQMTAPRAPVPEPLPPAPSFAARRATSLADKAEADLRAFDNQGVRAFGPALGQKPTAAIAKQLSDMPILGAPLRNALEESITGLRDRVATIADEIHPAPNYEGAGLHLKRADGLLQAAGAATPGEAAQSFVKSVLGGQRRQTQQVRLAMSALRPEQKQEFSSLILRELGAPSASARGLAQNIDFSVSSFFTRWRTMTDEAKASFFNGEHRAAINDLVAIADRLANVEALADRGGNTASAVGLGAVLGTAGSASFGGLMQSAGSGLALSVLLSRPTYARWAVKYARLKALARNAPGGAKVAIGQHFRELKNLALFDPQLTALVSQIAVENGIDE